MNSAFWPVVRATVPAVAWRPVLAGSVALFFIAVWTRLVETDQPLNPMRFAALACVSGAAFTLEDPASPTPEPYPVPLRVRCAGRALLGLTPAAVAWTTSALVAPLRTSEIHLLTVEIVALAALATTTTLVALRCGAQRPGLVAGPVVFALVLLSARLGSHGLLPYDVALHADTSPLRNAITRCVFITTLAAITSTVATIDPARQRRPRAAGT